MNYNQLLKSFFIQPPFDSIPWIKGFVKQLDSSDIVIPDDNSEKTYLQLCLLLWIVLGQMGENQYQAFLKSPDCKEMRDFFKMCGQKVKLQNPNDILFETLIHDGKNEKKDLRLNTRGG